MFIHHRQSYGLGIDFSRPYGTRPDTGCFPGLKRRAIGMRAYGTQQWFITRLNADST